jgi:glucose/arabinose dehydrogenase
VFALAGLAALLGAVLPAEAQTQTQTQTRFKVETFARDLVHPWGMQFLPDGRVLVTERPGRMRIVSREGRLSEPIAGVPAVAAINQGGLLDVLLDPRFTNGVIYFSYAEPRDGGRNGTAVARARLVLQGAAGRLDQLQVIFRQLPDGSGGLHFGSRLAFADDGTLLVALGERYQKEMAQRLDNHYGKVVRIRPDGSVPPDNPFVGRQGVRPELWSYGHRNPQSAAIHPVSRKLWTVEHGAKGGDEINIPQAGRNYGWPVITYGRDYSGARIGIGTHREGMEQPIYYWDPSIAPSGMAFYTGDLFPAWKGNLFVGSLVLQHLNRLTLDGEKVVGEERLLQDLGERIRDVRSGPDGALWLLTDNPRGRILRLVPDQG